MATPLACDRAVDFFDPMGHYWRDMQQDVAFEDLAAHQDVHVKTIRAARA